MTDATNKTRIVTPGPATEKTEAAPAPALVKRVEDSANRFTEAYQADEIEKEVDRLGKFDARMEKIIRRIIQIKLFKRVDGVDSSNAPLLEAPLWFLFKAPRKSRRRLSRKDRGGAKPIAPKASRDDETATATARAACPWPPAT